MQSCGRALQHRGYSDTFSFIIRYRVRNNLQLIFGMLNRQIEISTNGGQEGIRAIAVRVMSLASIYDRLLGNGLSRTINFDQHLRSLCASLRNFHEEREFGVELTFDGAAKPLLLDLDSVTALGIIVAEVITNA